MKKAEKQSLEQKIIANIVSIRKQLKITQADIADVIFTDASNYSKIESGIQHLSIDNIEKIAKLFNMSSINLITYPDRYVKPNKSKNKTDKIKVLIETEIDRSKLADIGLEPEILRVIYK
jgi:transcriptional regulator with XRE-family HTH domain